MNSHRKLIPVLFAMTLSAGCEDQPTPQTIRVDGVYYSVEHRGERDDGTPVYHLHAWRFFENGNVAYSLSMGAFDPDEQIREVAAEGYLSDAELDASKGTWTLEVSRLTTNFPSEGGGTTRGTVDGEHLTLGNREYEFIRVPFSTAAETDGEEQSGESDSSM